MSSNCGRFSTPQVLSTLQVRTHFILEQPLRDKCYHLHSKDEETEAERVQPFVQDFTTLESDITGH